MVDMLVVEVALASRVGAPRAGIPAMPMMMTLNSMMARYNLLLVEV